MLRYVRFWAATPLSGIEGTSGRTGLQIPVARKLPYAVPKDKGEKRFRIFIRFIGLIDEQRRFADDFIGSPVLISAFGYTNGHPVSALQNSSTGLKTVFPGPVSVLSECNERILALRVAAQDKIPVRAFPAALQYGSRISAG